MVPEDVIATRSDAPSRSDASAPVPLRTVGLVVTVAALLVVVWPAASLWMVLSGIAVALSVGVPLLVADAPRAAERTLVVVGVLLALFAGLAGYARANGDGSVRDRAHDGGVIVTREAALEVGSFQNPYTRDYDDALPPSWDLVEGSDGVDVANPVKEHFPYLPAAAMVHTPFAKGADALGVRWDPRILGWIAMVAAMAAVARRPEPAWMRLGVVAGIAGPFSIAYLAWGTNDVLAASLAVLALCAAGRRPWLAGLLLAVALSTKLLLAVLLPPLVLLVVAHGGWSALKRWWTLPATLAVTCLPYLAADPAAFLDDTVWFNLGRSKPVMPTSGLGLPAVAPDVFSGPVLALVTLLGLAVAVALPLWAVRRWPSIWTVGAASGVALLALLVPARTFQINYLVLIATLLPLGWLALADARRRASGEAAVG